MTKLSTLLLLIALSVSQFLTPKAYAIQCKKVLSGEPSQHTSINIRINTRLQELSSQSQHLTESLHRSVGQLSYKLTAHLSILLESPLGPIAPGFNDLLQESIQQDPIARKLSRKAVNKMIHLVKTKTMKPYMAFLVARYMDTIEGQSPVSLDYETLEKIDRLVESYTFARALVRAKTRLRSLPDIENFRSVEEYLNGKRIYKINKINYNKPNYLWINDSLFETIIQEVENEIAATNAIELLLHSLQE